MDWFASGGPRAGREASRARAADAARRDVPTCRLTERRGDVACRVRAAGWHACVVVDDARVVLGLLDGPALAGDPAALAGDAMRPAPTTVRPHVTLEDAVEGMKTRQRDHVVVTTSDGALVGLLWRLDAERRLAAPGTTAQAVSR